MNNIQMMRHLNRTIKVQHQQERIAVGFTNGYILFVYDYPVSLNAIDFIYSNNE
jgi:hypothetical protein